MMLDAIRRIFNWGPKGPPIVRAVQIAIEEINPRYLKITFAVGGHQKTEFIATSLIRRVEEVQAWTVGSGKGKEYTWHLKVYAADLRDPITFICPTTNDRQESEHFQRELLRLRRTLTDRMVES